MSASTPAAGTTGRNTSVAHFLAPHWGRIADRLGPVIDREGGEPGTSPAALICVPDTGAAVELAAALRLARPGIARILPVTDALRAARVIKTYGAPIVIVTPTDAERLLAASALPLDGVQVIALVSADEFDADQLANVMTSVPKEARRVLIASDATVAVEALLERYFHKAHRLADDAASETTPAAVQYQCVRGTGASAVPALLDDLDPPSAVVVTTDPEAVHAALAAHGYPADAPIVQVTDGAAAQNVALVIFAGLPSASAFETAMAAQPGRAVALVAPRQLSALRRLAGAAGVTPFTTRRATSTARAHEERLRAELKSVLGTSYPAREILALEPMLAEFDGVELAGAALRLLETSRAAVAAPAPAAAAAPAPRAERGPSAERAPRSRDAFPLREQADPAKPRFVDRTVRRDRDERPPRRASGDREERAPRAFGDKPRSFGDKPRAYGDKPRAYGDKPRAYGDKPRAFGDKPRAFGDKPRAFGDKPRSGFGDKPRSGFGAKRPFGDKPRGTGPRKPRGEK
ncbi:MAG: hypothetical protein P3B98_11325 [Gemmatimonadota bacterium]|nr:hypothetical protein [Gemmatimonadota bacterium]